MDKIDIDNGFVGIGCTKTPEQTRLDEERARQREIKIVENERQVRRNRPKLMFVLFIICLGLVTLKQWLLYG